METILLSLSILLLFIITQANSANCPPTSCNPTGPIIRFPFRLNRQPTRCGYPGFDLHCNRNNDTILTLPGSGEFIVDYIDYARQALFINDPDSCLPNRLLNFTLSGSPFMGENSRRYTFLNCSSSWQDYSSSRLTALYCISTRNYTIFAMDSRGRGVQLSDTCRTISDVLVPMQWAFSMFYWSPMDLREDLQLVWTDPPCWGCENRGGICGYREDSGSQLGCSRSSRGGGLPRSAKLGIIIGIGIPGLICLIGLICYSCGMIKAFNLHGRLTTELPLTTVSTQRLAVRSQSGLDDPTIESYPKTVLGASRRLPKPSDTTCPICLAEYLPEETLRTIPECNHYFHADCIDEWLKLNGTCPLCRNSPQTPSMATSSSSSMSMSSSTSATSDER